ncbi:MAG: glycosyltransferase [Acidobacteriota bacterium]|nr:glycosyltransferase [Acidobacteriota bacterium]
MTAWPVAPGVPIMTRNGRLRVLHIGKYYAPHKGGMETYLQSLCGEMQDLVDIEVIVANETSRARTDMVERIKVSRMGTLFNFASAPVCPGMVRQIRRSEADLVHIHLPNPTAILAFLASGHAGRLVVGYHSDIIRQKILGKVFEPILHVALRRSSALIAASPNYVQSSKILSSYRDRCHVIPYGIRLERFDDCQSNDVAQIRARFGPRLILSVGRLVCYKGYKYLIEAMQKIDGRLAIAGEGRLRGDLEREIADRGLSGRVALLGEVEDLAPWYHAADVFVLSSITRGEAFGIVQLEAMSCGKPVVNTALASGVPYVSVHGVTGLTVPPADAEALAGSITKLLDDSELRARYGQAARRRVQREFSLKGMAQRTYRLYEEVMRHPADGSRLAPESRDGIHSAREQ